MLRKLKKLVFLNGGLALMQMKRVDIAAHPSESHWVSVRLSMEVTGSLVISRPRLRPRPLGQWSSLN